MEREQLVALLDPRRGRLDGAGWDVDREVVPRVGAVAREREADDRVHQADLDATVAGLMHRDAEGFAPECGLRCNVRRFEAELEDSHA